MTPVKTSLPEEPEISTCLFADRTEYKVGTPDPEGRCPDTNFVRCFRHQGEDGPRSSAPPAASPPGTLAKAARRSAPSAARRVGGSLGPFRSTACIATPASPEQGWRALRRWAASVAARPLCRECDGTGWIPYRSETLDGELEEAYRLCPNHCTPRRCTDVTTDHPCPHPATAGAAEEMPYARAHLVNKRAEWAAVYGRCFRWPAVQSPGWRTQTHLHRPCRSPALRREAAERGVLHRSLQPREDCARRCKTAP